MGVDMVDITAKRAALTPNRIAFEDALTGRTLTYAQLEDRCARAAAVLASLGVTREDRVAILCRNRIEFFEIMFACAKLGAIFVPLNWRSPAAELSALIADCSAKLLIFGADDEETARTLGGASLGLDDGYEAALAAASPLVTDRRWAGDDTWFLMYTSGTTGQPKGVVRDNGGHAVALNWSMRNIYNMERGEVFWAASDVGWVVGHSYIVYAPLLTGATTVLYEGKPVGTPDPGAFWRVISEHKAMALFTAPTAFRAIRREDPDGKLLKTYDLSKFRTLFLAGERGDPPTVEWAQKMLGVPVIDHWWQTETGWAICGNFVGVEAMPVKLGSCSMPAPGWQLDVLDENGQPMKAGEVGALAGKLPLPPGTFPTLWNADERYRQSYMVEFPGYYKTGDAGFIDEDGYVSVMTRVDDVINVAGHRLSTGQIEEVLGAHADVAECAVIGVADELKGQVPLGFLVLKAGVDRPHEEIKGEVVQMVRDRIGPVAFFKSALVVQRLPKTRSGKILRGTMQKMADNLPWTLPATIEDPVVLDEIKDGLKGAGFAAKG